MGPGLRYCRGGNLRKLDGFVSIEAIAFRRQLIPLGCLYLSQDAGDEAAAAYVEPGSLAICEVD
jgi:hypothetical protein